MKIEITLPDKDRTILERWLKSRAKSDKQKFRAKIILMTADGMLTREIMVRLGTTNVTLNLWRKRYLECGVDGLLKGRTRPPGIAKTQQDKVDDILELTLAGKPADATHWSCRRMAAAVGMSKDVVCRIWREHGLKPHLRKGFKVSNDPKFKEKLRDVVGLYVDPPEQAVVFSVDEKTGIQALDRTQPGLPLKKGRAGTLTHDYKRHGTTTLFAALNVRDGTVIGECMQRHRNGEFVKFLSKLHRSVDRKLAVHVIVDNYSPHKHENVGKWLAKHPRFHLHFTPTSASWLNLVERFFRDLTEDQIRRGVFRSLAELKSAIMGYLEYRNGHPKIYQWTAKPEDILAKVERAKDMLATQH